MIPAINSWGGGHKLFYYKRIHVYENEGSLSFSMDDHVEILKITGKFLQPSFRMPFRPEKLKLI